MNIRPLHPEFGAQVIDFDLRGTVGLQDA